MQWPQGEVSTCLKGQMPAARTFELSGVYLQPVGLQGVSTAPEVYSEEQTASKTSCECTLLLVGLTLAHHTGARLPEAVSNLAIQPYWKALISQA